MKKKYQTPIIQVYAMSMANFICDSINHIQSNEVGYGGGGSGTARANEGNEWEDWEEE